MQSVSSKPIQQQIIPAPLRSPGTTESSIPAAIIAQRSKSVTLPEDVVTLSQNRITTLSAKKEPSAAVTLAESKALRDVFSVYA